MKPSRYTQIKFPPYRFIPGENPHPTENPLGHSYGKKEREAVLFVLDDWKNIEQYLFGIDLYNYGYWWESHEALESLWRIAPRGHVSRDYLQGLIKISAAFLKWHLRQQKGLEYLYAGAVNHFLKISKEYPVYMGLNIAEHIQKLRIHFNQVVEYHKWVDPLNDYPYIVLILGKEIEPGHDRTIMKRTQDVVTREEKEYLKYILRAEYEGYGMISEGYRGRNF